MFLVLTSIHIEEICPLICLDYLRFKSVDNGIKEDFCLAFDADDSNFSICVVPRYIIFKQISLGGLLFYIDSSFYFFHSRFIYKHNEELLRCAICTECLESVAR